MLGAFVLCTPGAFVHRALGAFVHHALGAFVHRALGALAPGPATGWCMRRCLVMYVCFILRRPANGAARRGAG